MIQIYQSAGRDCLPADWYFNQGKARKGKQPGISAKINGGMPFVWRDTRPRSIRDLAIS